MRTHATLISLLSALHIACIYQGGIANSLPP